MNIEHERDMVRCVLTAAELFRLGRGDFIQVSGWVAQGINRVEVKCESSQAGILLEDTQFELRRAERELAVERSRRLRSHTIGDAGTLALVIPTVGDSCARMERLLAALQVECVRLNVPIMVIDDGAGFEDAKKTICENAGAFYTRNDGKPGIPGALNIAIGLINTTKHQWFVVVDDGSLPHKGWLTELVVVALQKLPREVAMLGTAHLQDWQLAMGGLLGTRWPLHDWTHRFDKLHDIMTRHFYYTFPSQHSVAIRDTLQAISTLVPDTSWHEEVQHVYDLTVCDLAPVCLDDMESTVWSCKYDLRNRWPESQTPLRVCWSPGAQGLLLRTEIVPECGGFTDDCVAYEQLLAIKAARTGKYSVFWDGPPFLHTPSLGFREVGEQNAPERAHMDIYSVCEKLWSTQSARDIVRQYVSTDQEAEYNTKLLENAPAIA